MGRAPEKEPRRDVNAVFDPRDLFLKHQDKLLSPHFSSSLCSLNYITFILLFFFFSIVKNIVSHKNIKNAQIIGKKRQNDEALAI